MSHDPVPNTIFVFGSNLAGRHGAGAAATAREYYGAEYGVGEGRTGRSYALPTKDFQIRTRSVHCIEVSVQKFCEYARRHPDLRFRVTPFGTGLAGLDKELIAAMLTKSNMPANCDLTSSWLF